jgi:predicted nucleic-acid-binding Zn-ribbon protein
MEKIEVPVIQTFNQAVKQIESKWKDHSCPICTNKEWLISTRIWKFAEYETAESIMPFIAMMCQNCNYTILFNAIGLGVVEKNDQYF